MNHFSKTSIPQANGLRQSGHLLAALLFAFASLVTTSIHAADAELEQFKIAWDAARRGDHSSFTQIKNTLQDYVLYPYLQYEDYRNRRASVPVDEMSGFLETHQDWAFSNGLRSAWLKSLAKKGRWAELVEHSEGVGETILRCQRARGQIILKQTDGVLREVQKLWAVGKSQPDECDPAFAWLIKNGGVTESLAWERIQLAMVAGNRRMTIYLARFVPEGQRRWLEDWQKLSRAGYSRLERSRSWPLFQAGTEP